MEDCAHDVSDSGNDSQPASGTRYARLLEGFIETLGIRSAILLGNSIGGAACSLPGGPRPLRTFAPTFLEGDKEVIVFEE